MSDPSDWAQHDGSPLTEREHKMLRAIIQEHEREAWARRRIRVLVPWVVAAVGAVWGFFEWFGKYFTVRGGS